MSEETDEREDRNYYPPEDSFEEGLFPLPGETWSSKNNGKTEHGGSREFGRDAEISRKFDEIGNVLGPTFILIGMVIGLIFHKTLPDIWIFGSIFSGIIEGAFSLAIMALILSAILARR